MCFKMDNNLNFNFVVFSERQSVHDAEIMEWLVIMRMNERFFFFMKIIHFEKSVGFNHQVKFVI